MNKVLALSIGYALAAFEYIYLALKGQRVVAYLFIAAFCMATSILLNAVHVYNKQQEGKKV